MERFDDTGCFFGSPLSLVPSAASDKLQLRLYYKLAQLSGVSILTNGRGPECLHPSIARAIFNIEDDAVDEVADVALKFMISQIEHSTIYTKLSKEYNNKLWYENIYQTDSS